MQPDRCVCTTERSRRRWRLALPAASLLFVVILCLGACGGEPQIAKKAVGWWQEIGTAKAFTMHVASTGPYRYAVAYPRSFKGGIPAGRNGDKIVIWGEDTNDILWTLTYDPASDQLKAVGSLGTFTFKRIAAPGT